MTILFSIFYLLFSGFAFNGPTFVLSLADGAAVAGPVEQIGDNWSVRLGGVKPVSATGLQAIGLRRAVEERGGEGEKGRGGERISPGPHALPSPPRPLPPSSVLFKELPAWPRNEQVILANGDRLPGTVRELNGDRLRVRTDLSKEADLTIPLSAVSVIWIAAPDGVDNVDKWRRRLAAAKRSRDAVYLRNGDVVEGTLNAINGQTRDAQIESAKKDVAVPFSKIAVIALNSELIRPLRAEGIYARLVLDSGCRLTLNSAQTDHGVLRGKPVFGGSVHIPFDRIRAIDWLGGCVVYLSDLKPRGYQFRSFLAGASWPYLTDASVMESDLRLGGQLYDKGLGVHTASRLTYTLGPDDRTFEALVGLDDAVGKKGSAHVQILVDGKPQKLEWDGNLTGQSGPRLIRLSVTGAKELTLVADFGDFGDVQGCVDWANARLIKNRK